MGSIFDNEHRHYKRFPNNVQIRFRRLDLSGVLKELKTFQNILATATNVADLGVFIVSQELHPKESIIELVFHFEPQGREIHTLARVIWVCHDREEKGMGVELIKVAQDLYLNVVARAKRGNWVEAERK
jgi:hypothetical protein